MAETRLRSRNEAHSRTDAVERWQKVIEQGIFVCEFIAIKFA